jgi:hypothetical protein
MKRYGKLLVATASAFAMLGVGSVAGATGGGDRAGPPSDNGVKPRVVPERSSCTDLQPDGVEWFELKFKDLAWRKDDTVTKTDGMINVTIEIEKHQWGQKFSWESDLGVDAVIAKGMEPGANFYEYNPPEASTGDSFLHSPVQKNGEFAKLVKVRFCYQKPTPPTSESTTTTEKETTTTTVEETTTTTVEETTTTTAPPETTTTTAPPEAAAPPPAQPAQPVVGQPNFIG